MMYELLKHFPRDSFILVSRIINPSQAQDDRILDAPMIQIDPIGSRVQPMSFRLLLLPFVALELVRQIRRFGKQPRNVFAVFPTLDFLLLSAFISRLFGIPLFVYLHDCIFETAVSLPQKVIHSMAERLTFRTAVKIYAISDLMKNYYLRRGFSLDVLPHGVDMSLVRSSVHPQNCTKPTVGFAGQVYETNDKGIMDLIEAKRLSGGMIRIQFAMGDVAYLRKLGALESIDAIHCFDSHIGVLNFLSDCDVLFLPMNHESVFWRDLQTIFPTKVTDYWLAQRPILVYGPECFAFVRQARDDGYAKVVMERAPEKILGGIREILDSPILADSLVKASRAKIRAHDSTIVAQKLIKDLGIE